VTTRTILPLPRIGSNEDEATVIEWTKSEGDCVRTGEVVCTAETTKSLFEVEAAAEGYLFILAPAGASLAVGRPLAVISSDPADTRSAIAAWLAGPASPAAPPPATAAERTRTRKAELLARRHGIDLSLVPAHDGRVGEADVLAYLQQRGTLPAPSLPAHGDIVDGLYRHGRLERLAILGGGDGAVQVLDAMFKSGRQRAVAIFDDNPHLHGRTIMGVPVAGPIREDLVTGMLERDELDGAVISISTLIPLRRRIFEQLTARGVPFANVIHPTACVGTNVRIGRGNVILGFCHIGACAVIGDNNFLSAYVSIEHHNELGSHCSYGPAVVASSRVTVGDGTRFGTGVFIEPKLNIGAESVIGSGCILRGHVPAHAVVRTRLNHVLRPPRQSSPEQASRNGSAQGAAHHHEEEA
jgi:sugar O-acyltransferase (sialic acid O-acetyltransferase NeuD family)